MAKKVKKEDNKVDSGTKTVGEAPKKVGKEAQKVVPQDNTIESDEEKQEEDLLKHRRDIKKYLTYNVGQKPPKSYDLKDDIRDQKLFKANTKVRDRVARTYLTECYERKSTSTLVPGQMVMFNYFQPKTKEDLEYYDAMPLTIFFGVYNSEQGKRIIGFNLHYYPPRIRMAVLDRIFQIFKPFYLKNFNKPLSADMKFFEYQWLMEQLENAKLDFGVRQYIPQLCTKFIPIPAEAWAKAFFTEGHFKKETREQIMKYWRDRMAKAST